MPPVKVQMIENPPKPRKTRASEESQDPAGDSHVAPYSDWKLGTDLDWHEMFNQIDSEISETGAIDHTTLIRTFVRYLLIPSSPFNLNTIKEKISSLEERIDKRESEIANKDSEILDLKNKVIVLQKHKKDLKKQVESLSYDSHKTRVTLANIPLSHPKDNKESVENTTKTVEEILKLSGQSINSVKEFNRIYPNESKQKNAGNVSKVKPKDPKIFLDFQNLRELRKFTQKIKEIRAQEKYQTMILDNVCPDYLLKDYLNANEKGFLLRTKQKMLTRTYIKANGIVLKAKKPGPGPFEIVDWKTIELS